MHSCGWCEDAADLSKKARRIISREECLLSVASMWEISIKLSQGKLKLPGGHVAGSSRLPWHHPDPFDRLLIAQAIEEEVHLISRDSVFDRYDVNRIW